MAEQNAPGETVLPWTDERVDLLRKLWEEGHSASRIAAQLAGGVTRNAVIGKVHRLGLSGRVKAQAASPARRAAKPLPEKTQAPSRVVFAPVHGNAALQMQTRPQEETRPHYDGNVVPLTSNVTIMDLRDSMCRWPVGDPSSPEFRYCGGKATIGEGPYCSHHSRMAYQPTQDRRQRKSA